MLSGRRDWLSITPEPERVLPRAVATLRAGGPPSKGEVERERERAEKLVLHGSRNSWLAWLEDIEALARQMGAESIVALRSRLVAPEQRKIDGALALVVTGACVFGWYHGMTLGAREVRWTHWRTWLAANPRTRVLAERPEQYLEAAHALRSRAQVEGVLRRVRISL